MTQGATVAMTVLLLILPISALAARRLPLGTTLRMALGWVAIFGIGFLLVALWQAATGTGALLGGGCSHEPIAI